MLRVQGNLNADSASDEPNSRSLRVAEAKRRMRSNLTIIERLLRRNTSLRYVFLLAMTLSDELSQRIIKISVPLRSKTFKSPYDPL